MKEYKDLIFQIVGMLLAAGCIYGTMNNRLGVVEAKADNLEAKVERSIEKNGEQLNRIEKAVTDINRDMWWVKKKINRE